MNGSGYCVCLLLGVGNDYYVMEEFSGLQWLALG